MARFGRALRWLVPAALALAYPFFAHYAAAAPAASDMGLALALLPFLAAVAVFARRSARRYLWLALCLPAAFGLAESWAALRDHFGWLYFVQHAGTNAALGGAFAVSLKSGRMPLCSRLAALAHGELAPEVVRYTRQVTQAWTVYFGLTTLVSGLLFFLAPLDIWSAFANFLSPAALIATFLVEYAVRLRVLPRMKHSSMLASVRGFWASPAERNAAGEQACAVEKETSSASCACPAAGD